ncbi:hypothetical protein GIB67_021146 [Kingdonia uniflora]|uniref:Uncharacterized protein n=1 Tax=Kingdonia uniflora TaxID=39325 RepID=A0A7J7N788_9MAGN|nr:hypothetical protein GIB67_021146 [Kingdonia uniflora]
MQHSNLPEEAPLSFHDKSRIQNPESRIQLSSAQLITKAHKTWAHKTPKKEKTPNQMSLFFHLSLSPSLKKMPSFLNLHSKTLITLPLLIFSTLFIIYLLLTHTRLPVPIPRSVPDPPPTSSSLQHIVFSIASSSKSWPKRNPYLRIWYNCTPEIRAYVFLDRINTITNTDDLPPLLISEDTSRFPYTYKSGLRSAIRVSRIVKEIVDRNLTGVRWFVFGDDDTVFVPMNVAKTLSKYEWERWWYVGSNSESYDQNVKYSFDMAFGGGGFALSYPVARVLAKVFDKCLVRYSGLYGSDSRVFSCLAELGVGLTHEAGFHQVDVRGDLFGMLSTHPLTPLVSLHHLDYIEPIFPTMNRTRALEHLFEAVKADPQRIFQQNVCYDHSRTWTLSISWGYAVQIFEGNQLLPDLLQLQRTFVPWKRNVNIHSSPYMFNSREFPKDPCQRPVVFFMESVSSHKNGIQSNYSRYLVKNCSRNTSLLEKIRVFSQKLELDVGQLQAPRRHCCDILHSTSDKEMEIGIRQCRDEELISMTH